MHYKFTDAIEVNPKEKMKKGNVAKKVSMKDLSENDRTIRSYSVDQYKGGSKFRNEDTLFARITPCLENGKIAQVNILDEDELAFGSTEFIVFRAKKEFTIPDYVYYLVNSDYIKNPAIKSMTGTSGRQRVQNKIFDEMYVYFPKLETQYKITSILNNLENKINLNNKIIENLESQAQAIFKLWFVDFEQFQDGNFVESELGLIPEGWKVEKLGDIFKFIKGKKPKDLVDGYTEDSIPYIVKGVIDGTDKPKYTLGEKIVEVEELDYFMLMDGANSGNLYYGYAGALGSTFSVIDSNESDYSEIIYWFLRINETLIKNQNTGSAIPHANKDFIYNMKLALPNKVNEVKANKLLENIRRLTIKMIKQNQLLAQTRDTLLPKLMSGEIDVSNIKIDEDVDYD